MLRWRLDIRELLLKKNFAKTKIQNCGNKGTVCSYQGNLILK